VSTKYKVKATGKTVTLSQDALRATGGEGTVYVLDDTVYKVCHPGKMIPEGKFAELHALDHKRIVRPESLLLDSKGVAVGYTMRLVPNGAVPLAQILTRAYREREGVTPAMMAALVQQIHDGIRFVHSRPGYLQIDGNEWNYMVTADHRDVYFIDVNAFATPGHPPVDPPIMASVRDWRGGLTFSTLTDHFGYAVISFYMFVGIHPYKGSHPAYPNVKTAMIERMTAGVSILDKDADFPKAAVYHPFANHIPGGDGGAYMQWYRAIFLDQKRLPPPDSFQAVVAVAAVVKEIVGSNNFDIAELRQYVADITGYAERGGREIVVTADGFYIDGFQKPKLPGRVRVGLTAHGTPVALVLDGGRVSLVNLNTGAAAVGFDTSCEDIMSCEGRLYYRSANFICEIICVESANQMSVLPKPVANVLPHATDLHQGAAFQHMFGATIASVFPGAGHHRQLKMPELDGLKVTEAGPSGPRRGGRGAPGGGGGGPTGRGSCPGSSSGSPPTGRGTTCGGSRASRPPASTSPCCRTAS
jgi:hypothetical protein